MSNFAHVLQASVAQYRASLEAHTKATIAESVRHLSEQEEKLAQRLRDVEAREAAVAARERQLTQAMERLIALQRQAEQRTHEDMSSPSPLARQQTLVEAPSSTPRSQSSSNRVAVTTLVEGGERTPPPAIPVPRLNFTSLSPSKASSAVVVSGVRSGTRKSPSALTPERQRSVHDSSPSALLGSRGISPALYEGPVDPDIPSHVEEIPSDDDGAPKPAPRGLRSSPQFQPMDPNDSGLGFLRRGTDMVRRQHYDDDDDQDEVVVGDEAGDDGLEEGEEDDDGYGDDDEDDAYLNSYEGTLQQQFDEAVSYLVGHGLASIADIQGWMDDGADHEQIIRLYLQEMQARERAEQADLDAEAWEAEEGVEEEEEVEGDDDEGMDGGVMPLSNDGAVLFDATTSSVGDVSRGTGTPPPSASGLGDGGADGGVLPALGIGRARGSFQGSPRKHVFDSFDASDDDETF